MPGAAWTQGIRWRSCVVMSPAGAHVDTRVSAHIFQRGPSVEHACQRTLGSTSGCARSVGGRTGWRSATAASTAEVPAVADSPTRHQRQQARRLRFATSRTCSHIPAAVPNHTSAIVRCVVHVEGARGTLAVVVASCPASPCVQQNHPLWCTVTHLGSNSHGFPKDPRPTMTPSTPASCASAAA